MPGRKPIVPQLEERVDEANPADRPKRLRHANGSYFRITAKMRMTISFARHQFPSAIIRQAVWLYMRFTLSYPMGFQIRAIVRPRTSPQTPAANIAVASRRDGRDHCGPGCAAVDDESEVLDLLVQRRRDKAAAEKLMRKLLKKQGFAPEVSVTDKLRSYRSYGVAKAEIGSWARHDRGLRKNNRAANSH